jgi:hypothetical protein
VEKVPETPAPRNEYEEVPELSEDERLLVEDLRRDVQFFSEKVGERHGGKSWELAEVADHLALQLEQLGLPVERQGYETDQVAAQNLAVTLAGGGQGDEVLLVGAHYDSPVGSPGRNAGASGTAALLSLVRLMKGARLERTLRFVFFSMGESPHGDGEGRGARHYAREIAKAAKEKPALGIGPIEASAPQAETIGLLHLDRLGHFQPQKKGQASPVLVHVGLTPGSVRLGELVSEELSGAPFLLSSSNLELTEEDSDARAFYESGVPTLTVSGGGADDAAVSYEHLAQVVMRLRHGIGRICGEKPTNDGMLTPLLSEIR